MHNNPTSPDTGSTPARPDAGSTPATTGSLTWFQRMMSILNPPILENQQSDKNLKRHAIKVSEAASHTIG